MALKSHGKFEEKLPSGLTWGILKILIRTLERVKIGTFMAPFCPKQKMYELKIYRGVTVVGLKNDEKSEGELICRFKIDIRNFKVYNV